MHIRLNKRDRFIISIDGTIKHLTLFAYGLFNKIHYKIKYFISKKRIITNSVVLQIVLLCNGITNSINHNFG